MFSPPVFQFFLYIVCFFLVWVGAGLIVSTTTKLASSWKIPPFILSFFLLGILTSLPEITISTISILQDDPVIMVGTLLGGVIVLFLGVIPLLGLVGNGIRIPKELDRQHLVMTLLVVVAPAFLTADQRLERWEALFLIILYGCLFLFFSSQRAVDVKDRNEPKGKGKSGVILLLQMVVGIALLIGASNQIVHSTLYFADLLKISPFFVSLIMVAIGTNIPELSIIFRSVLQGKKDVAFGDYLGSASANTLLLGGFTLLSGKDILLPNHFLQRFVFFAIGLILFFIFAQSKKFLSRNECAILLSLYGAFIIFEVFFVL